MPIASTNFTVGRTAFALTLATMVVMVCWPTERPFLSQKTEVADSQPLSRIVPGYVYGQTTEVQTSETRSRPPDALCYHRFRRLRNTNAIRWMAIGDSITQGLTPLRGNRLGLKRYRKGEPVNGSCSFLGRFAEATRVRPPVHPNDTLMSGTGWIEFVGPFDSAYGGPYSATCPAPTPRHAAKWAVAARQMTSERGYARKYTPGVVSLDGTDRAFLDRGAPIYDWVRDASPNVVSILFGTNDLAWFSVDSLENQLRSIVAQVLRAAEDSVPAVERKAAYDWQTGGGCEVIVLLMTLLPRQDQSTMSRIAEFNARLTKRQSRWMQDRCIDMLPVVDGLRADDLQLFYDGTHPTAAGESIIADNLLRHFSCMPSVAPGDYDAATARLARHALQSIMNISLEPRIQ